MFGKIFIGVILPQAPVYLTQTNNDFPLSPVKSWNKYLTIWIELWAHKMQGFARFVVKTNKSWFTRFWGKILNSNFHPCKKFDILQVWERGGWKVGFVKVGALIIREWVREKGATVERERVQCTAASLDHTWCYNHSWVQCTTARWRKKTNRRELGLVRLISSAPLIGANETIVKFPCLDPPLTNATDGIM